jgi:tetraacyldisaccharide 4'-kinase
MTRIPEDYVRGVMSGENESARAMALRALTACVEPFYAGIMHLRNRFYETAVFKSHALGLPTISVGNITTGGTGKTPVVRWLARRLADAGKRPAILMRGYWKPPGGRSDEEIELENSLAGTGAAVPVFANPDRVASADKARALHPELTTFILDDAMQHRRARRDFNLVLINATEPFGYNRVFPRGMLREPLEGLSRADAFLITHADEAATDDLEKITADLEKLNPTAPVFHCEHRIDHFRTAQGEAIAAEKVQARKYFAFCGVGSPRSFFMRLASQIGTPVGQKTFPDHENYSQLDYNRVLQQARETQADVVITTEKDWSKVSRLSLPALDGPPIYRAQLKLAFDASDEEQLLQAILGVC